jgi:histidinol-phosphatase (PHP family)
MQDYHVHLERGPLSRNWLDRFLDQAHRQGIIEVGIVEHFYLFPEGRPLIDYVTVKEPARNWPDFMALIEAAKNEGLDLRLGLEVDYTKGREDDIRAALKGLPLDFVIGSVHSLNGWPFDLNRDTWQARDVAHVYRHYYDTLALAAKSGLFDILGHPGNIAYFGHRAEPELMAELEECFLERIAGLPICLEINTGGYLRPAEELFPRWPMVERIKHYGFDIVVSSDAHRPEDVGHAIKETRDRLKAMGFGAVQTFSRRKKSPVNL